MPRPPVDFGFNLHLEIPEAVTPSLAAIPPDIRGLRDQANFDIFAWLEFIALNWPSDLQTCAPRSGATLVSDVQSLRVWETWKTEAEIFVRSPATQRPAPWCMREAPRQRMERQIGALPDPVIQAFQERFAQTGVARALFELSKFSSTQLPAIQQAFGGPLVDQGGRFVRYEERVNRDEFDFIVNNGLWSKAGQTRWLATHATIDMPSGTAGGAVGAMEVKAAWKVLTPAELSGGRFYTIRALVTTGTDSAGRPMTSVEDMGLIGFHITHKSTSSPQWTWATFEHADNLSSSLHRAGCQVHGSCVAASLAPRLACPNGCCPTNCQTAACNSSACPELKPNGQPANPPVQVARLQDVSAMSPPDHDVGRVNAQFRRLLAGSVWANYELISTQWPSRPAQSGGVPAPPFLANVALETYNQGPSAAGSDGAVAYPGAGYRPFSSATSSSCLKCHATGVAAVRDRNNRPVSSDFSFLLGKAQ
ncbi:MAG TPA: hypothetical protein VIG99_23260 [Myxococcaceae bacterium]